VNIIGRTKRIAYVHGVQTCSNCGAGIADPSTAATAKVTVAIHRLYRSPVSSTGPICAPCQADYRTVGPDGSGQYHPRVVLVLRGAPADANVSHARERIQSEASRDVISHPDGSDVSFTQPEPETRADYLQRMAGLERFSESIEGVRKADISKRR
jgi:hypothetical protein